MDGGRRAGGRAEIKGWEEEEEEQQTAKWERQGVQFMSLRSS